MTERPKPPPDTRTAPELRAEAERLTGLQITERGTLPHPSNPKLTVPGPYVATPERERRAKEIVRLRRRAARLEHPTPAQVAAADR